MNLALPKIGSRRLRFWIIVGMLVCMTTTVASLLAYMGGNHPDPSMDDEHQAMLDLVPEAEVTHTAQQNGLWSDPTTWGGSVPGLDAKVRIPQGLVVQYDVASSPALSWLHVQGVVAFVTHADTDMLIETIVVSPGGIWQQGSVAQPIAAHVRSTVTFRDTGPLADRLKIGRGLLAHGSTSIHGQAVTPFLKTTSGLPAGADQFTLNANPSNWRVGDQLVVTGMAMKAVRQDNGWFEDVATDEVRTVSSINGTTVTLTDPLSETRVVDFAEFDLFPYVSNLSRNVVFTSQNKADPTRRGHVMFMHNPSVDVRYARFDSLGRTRKDIDVTDSDVQAEPTGDNPRGKYAFHFHRTGKLDPAATPAYAQGNVVVDSTSWAYVNHDSFVVFEDNVAHNSFGAAFITENGAEMGAFRRNLASTTTGRGFIKDGVPTHDLARSGTAFWFQGGNVIVEDNVATGAAHGYSYFERSYLEHNMHPNQRVYRQHLLQMEASGGQEYVESADTPIMVFKGNSAIGCQIGMFNVDNEINGRYPSDSVLEDFTVLNADGYAGINVEYYRNFTFRNVKVLRDSTFTSDQWSGVYAIQANHLVDHLYPWSTRSADRIDGVYIRGYTNAIMNDDGDLGDAEGAPQRKSRFEVLDNSLDFDGSGVAFNLDATFFGEPTIAHYASADIIPFPSFDPPVGYYTETQTVSLASVPGATIYYVIGGPQYQNPSLEWQLQPGSWTEYTGQEITISQNQRLIAIAIKDGIKSRPRNGVYRIDPTATKVAAPTSNQPAGTYQHSVTFSLNTTTEDAAIRYTLDGSDPRTSLTAQTIYNGQSITLDQTTTVKAFGYRGAMVDSDVTQITYVVEPVAWTDKLFLPSIQR